MSAVHTPMPSDLLVHGWQAPGAVCGHAAPEASPGAAPEVAEIFRVNPKTVTRWAQSGKISAIRTLGGHRRFRAIEILRYLEQIESEQGL